MASTVLAGQLDLIFSSNCVNSRLVRTNKCKLGRVYFIHHPSLRFNYASSEVKSLKSPKPNWHKPNANAHTPKTSV